MSIKLVSSCLGQSDKFFSSLVFRAQFLRMYTQYLCVNLLPVRPMKGRTALASRCLRSPLFDELTWENWPRKSCEGCGDFSTKKEEAEEDTEVDKTDEDEEEVWPLLHSSPSQPEK